VTSSAAGTGSAATGPRGLGSRLLLLAVSTMVALAAAELVLETWFPIGALVYRLDDRCLHRLVPGSRKLFIHAPENGGARVLVSIDDRGYRGPAIRRVKDRPRVLVLGDSFVEGEFSPLPETYVARLGDALTAAMRRPLETVNAGVVGYGPDQIDARIAGELDALAPDLVVLVLYAGNDFGDLIRDKMFHLGADGAAASTAYTIADSLRRDFRRSATWTRRVALVRLLRPWLRPASWRALASPARRESVDWIARGIARQRDEYQDYVVGGDDTVRDLFNDLYDAGMSTAPDDAMSRYKTALMRGVLARIRGTAAARGVPLLAVVVPAPVDVCDRYGIRVDPARYPAYAPSMLTDALARCCAEAGIPCLDLYRPFRDRGADDLYFRAPDDHWNAAGQALAARLTCDAVARNGWFGLGAAAARPLASRH
jgi:hypothetical protein